MCQMVGMETEVKQETFPVECFLDYVCYIKQMDLSFWLSFHSNFSLFSDDTKTNTLFNK